MRSVTGFGSVTAERIHYAVQTHPSLERHPVTRAPTKTATVTLRVSPEVKRLLAKAAEADRRSLANMFEVIVMDYCERHDLRAVSPPGIGAKG